LTPPRNPPLDSAASPAYCPWSSPFGEFLAPINPRFEHKRDMALGFQKRPIKILHVLDSLGVGGMERVVIDVANGLDASEFDQAVCCLSRKGEAARHLRDQTRCIDLGKGAAADYLLPLKIARVIRTRRPDIVHSQSWSGVDAALATRLARGGVRLIHSEHGRNLPYIHFEPWKRKLARRALYHAADAVFAISGEVRDYYCRETGFPPAQMTVIQNGIDLRRIAGADSTRVRAELGLAATDFVIGTVARLDATKDTHTLVRAFARLRAELPGLPLTLLVVGDGPERPTLERYAGEHGLSDAVRFTGVRHDVPRLLHAMDLFALSSLSEGLPITALEAMAASLPIVATRVGALPELVEEGATGFLVDPKQADAMAAQFARLATDRAAARQFGAAARRKVEREYSLDRMLRQYAELYARVAWAG
jgi:sugar transferase (PEP-CTERM/EpsH1 system associated)